MKSFFYKTKKHKYVKCKNVPKRNKKYKRCKDNFIMFKTKM